MEKRRRFTAQFSGKGSRFILKSHETHKARIAAGFVVCGIANKGTEVINPSTSSAFPVGGNKGDGGN